MRSLVFGVAAMIASGMALPAWAQDTASWNSPYGYGPGDKGNEVNLESLNVSWEATPAYPENRMRVVARFCNNTREDWEGGMRLTHIPPDRGHRTIRVPVGQCVPYEEILPRGSTDIYILLNEY